MLMSKSRLEKFLYALYSIDSSDLPNPLSRIEELYKCLVTGEEVPSFKPTSRVEKYLMAILGGYDVDSLPNPLSRVEVLLYKLATGDDNLDDVKSFLSEHEELLAEIIRNGGVGGNIDIEYVLYTLTTKYSALYNTAEKPVKSAILKGNTLVNWSKLNKDTEITSSGSSKIISTSDASLLKTNTVYTFIYWVEATSGTTVSNITTLDGTENVQMFDRKIVHSSGNLESNFILKFSQTSRDFTGYYGLKFSALNGSVKLVKSVILEGDYTNVDIPYFEGMTSVKMPVLTTTGKNLFDISTWKTDMGRELTVNTNGFKIEGSRGWFVLPVEIGEQYVLKYFGNNSDNNDYGLEIYETDNPLSLPYAEWSLLAVTRFTNPATISASHVFTYTPKKKYLIVFHGNGRTINIEQIQLEKGAVATSHEPFKSNILTVNEEVELRGIEDVKDTLDLMTGEVTHRLSEKRLTSDLAWVMHSSWQTDELMTFSINDINLGAGLVCNRFMRGDGGSVMGTTSAKRSFYAHATAWFICIYKNELSEVSVQGFKEWLDNNETNIIYRLPQQSVKTVDLSVVDQDGNDTELSTFNDITHVTLSSEGLIPEAELEVATKNEEDLEDSSVYTVHTLSEEHNTLYNTAEKPVKSAILKGQTLVNLVNDVTSNEVGNYSNSPCKINVIRNLQNETLTIIFNVISLEIPDGADGTLRIGWGWSGQIRYQPTLGVNKVLYNYNQTSNSWLGVFSNSGAYNLGQRITISDVMVLEGDYTNIDIPYFEGMQSVKMPVLTAMGENLIDSEIIAGWLNTSNGEINNLTSTTTCATKDLIKVKPATQYSVYKKYDKRVLYAQFNEKQELINFSTYTHNGFTTDSNAVYVRLFFETPVNEELKVMLYEGGYNSNISYEPYKSNILTVNEEVELRGIGDVQDELNCLTGELTQRIGESNSENFAEHYYSMELFNGYCAAVIKLNNKNKALSSAIKTNLVPTTQSFSNGLDCGIYNNPDNVVVFKKGTSLEEFKNFVSNLIIQYQLETPTVKTVDLSVVDQDGNNTKLSTFNDLTHVTLSSEGLIPEAELEVAEKVPEVAASMLTISREQEVINATTNEQSENVDATMIATTEIYEDLL